jgi:hypothetical protein
MHWAALRRGVVLRGLHMLAGGDRTGWKPPVEIGNKLVEILAYNPALVGGIDELVLGDAGRREPKAVKDERYIAIPDTETARYLRNAAVPRRFEGPSLVGRWRADWLAGVRGLELGNVDFLKCQPNSLVLQKILVSQTFHVTPATRQRRGT